MSKRINIMSPEATVGTIDANAMAKVDEAIKVSLGPIEL